MTARLKYSKANTIDIVAQALATASLLMAYGPRFFENADWWEDLDEERRQTYISMATLVIERLTEVEQ